jgi:hypothetical protein
LQLKPRWTKADHARISDLAHAGLKVHKQVSEDRYGISRPMRWS